jgi:putative hemolysin
MTLLLTVAIITIAISATCSLLEATLMSTRVPALEAARGGPHAAVAERFLEMKRDIASPTAAILIMNTVANTAGATLAGSLAVSAFGSEALGLFSALFTVAILFLAEIVPKTLGAVHWRVTWRFVVWPLSGLQKILKPAVFVTERTASLLVGAGKHKATTEGEIAAMIRLGATVGELSPTELQLLTSVLRFDEMRIREVMLPRRDVKTMRVGTSVADALVQVAEHLHTRYPVCRQDLDDAESIVHLKDLSSTRVNASQPIDVVARPLARVPETMGLSALLRQMQRTKQHMALVVDEFGTATGIVTLENLLEEIVGEVEDEFDHEAVLPPATESGARVLPGHTSLRVASELFEVELLGERVETLNGWLIEQLGRLPRPGDTVTVPGIHAEVLEIRRDQAAQIRLTPGESAAIKE